MVDPQNAEERLTGQLVEIWRVELLLGNPGPEVDFLEVDGSSLTATRIAARVGEVVGRNIEVAAIFDHSTPRALARAILASG